MPNSEPNRNTLKSTGRMRFIAFINAPFFIWILSVICITIGSGYFSSYQQCIYEADDRISKFHRAIKELRFRERAIYEAIEASENMSDIAKIPKIKGPYGELQKDNVFDLLDKVKQTGLKIKDHHSTTLSDALYPAVEFGNRFSSLSLGFVDLAFNLSDIPAAKKHAVQFHSRAVRAFAEEDRSTLLPNCSAIEIARGALGRPYPIKRLELSKNTAQAYQTNSAQVSVESRKVKTITVREPPDGTDFTLKSDGHSMFNK